MIFLTSHWGKVLKAFRSLIFFAGPLPVLLGIFPFLLSCSSESRIETKPQVSFPVTVASVSKKSVPLQVRAIGNVEAYSVVSVKSQVGGSWRRSTSGKGRTSKRGISFSL